MFYINRGTAEEFYGVYKGVLPEYLPSIEHFSNGPSVVLEVRQQNAVENFRAFVGPHDPEIAKHLKPDTLRAKFGHDKVKNAVHCTDMAEDGVLECEYFFNSFNHTKFEKTDGIVIEPSKTKITKQKPKMHK